MKLATYLDGSRDGQLVVVSRDLSQAHFANGIATRLQQVLDDWAFMAPQLEELSISLNHGRCRHAFAFNPAQCMAPLPRAFGWTVPEDGGRRASDALLGPHTPVRLLADPVPCAARYAVLHGDVARGIDALSARDAIRLLLLAAESPTHAAFAPVAVSPDELGAAWQNGRVMLPVLAMHNGRREGGTDKPEPGADFGRLLSDLAHPRALRAGSLVGATTAVLVPAVAAGDAVRFEVKDEAGHSIFGAIEQDVTLEGTAAE
ncbi:fumarylacetoacetate hydrolase [Roseateles sp.]|uniref:fumarylacetoacetate hydrolase n=1 Tax=Roseateles sp. TaxID=1971397 RepID=UPI00392DB021